jgi:mannose-6-phosphate isomerase-like protein (cupin superfamily)
MQNELIDILEYIGEGYQPLVDFGTWRVAFLRFIDELIPENIQRLERHIETDEVFVLLEGKAILFLGEGEEEIMELHSLEMKPGKLYNVRKNTWHCCVLSHDATILLVENKNTGKENTDYVTLDSSHRERLVKISGKLIEEWKK